MLLVEVPPELNLEPYMTLTGLTTGQTIAEAVSSPIALVAEDGFLTEQGIEDTIRRSGLPDSGEEIVNHLLLFKTRRQRTWLVSTTVSLFCLLDDDKTPAGERVIQWRQPKSAAREVKTRPYNKNPDCGLVDIGQRKNWLYSLNLHNPSVLESRVRGLAG